MNHEETVSLDRPAVDLSLLVVRVIVGVIFAVHGAQKLFGWLRGSGIGRQRSPIRQTESGPLGYPVTIGEFFGGLGLIVGFLTRFSAASLIVIMVGGNRHGARQERLLDAKRRLRIQPRPDWPVDPDLDRRPRPVVDRGVFLPLPKSPPTDRPIMILE